MWLLNDCWEIYSRSAARCVLGLMNDKEHQVKLLIDEEVLDSEYFGCHPCINTSSLKLKTSDVLDKLIPALGHAPVFVEL